jgi:hypothetical protein
VRLFASLPNLRTLHMLKYTGPQNPTIEECLSGEPK